MPSKHLEKSEYDLFADGPAPIFAETVCALGTVPDSVIEKLSEESSNLDYSVNCGWPMMPSAEYEPDWDGLF